jgi:hypothetical protein
MQFITQTLKHNNNNYNIVTILVYISKQYTLQGQNDTKHHNGIIVNTA